MKFKIHKLLAKPISYATGKRKRKDVKYIVIHWTGNDGDTARGNAKYFATSNTRKAGAHFFVGSKGSIYKSINMNRTAYSVGGYFNEENGAAKHYGVCNNANSVSIELCDFHGYPTDAQLDACRYLVKYIRKYCKNAKTIIRHWDVNGKDCPHGMTGKENKKWKKFLKEIPY